MGKSKSCSTRKKDTNSFEISVDSLNERQKDLIGSMIAEKINLTAKNDSQKKLLKSIKENQITICNGVAGSGKAQPFDSVVITPNGEITMENIKENDYVFGIDGKPIKIIKKFDKGEIKIYKINFTDGTSTESCDEHLWNVKSYNDRLKKRTYKTIELKNIINTLVTKSGRKNYSIPLINNPLDFKSKKFIIHPYLMGILLGDGSFINDTVTISCSDNEIINRIKELLPDKHELKEIKQYEKKRYDFQIVNLNGKNLISKAIKDYNLFKIKCDEKFIHNDYKCSSIEQRIDLLNGLMDSDGTIDKRGYNSTFSNSSIKLINDLRFIVESLGGVCGKTTKRIGKYKKDNDVINCKISNRISLKLPNNINPFFLKRKREKYVPKTKYNPLRLIESIEYVGKKKAYCILVDHPEHLYLTNNCIVTHNTLCSIYMALSLLREQNNHFQKILLVKSVTVLKNEELGFLKGDLREKVDPFMESFKSNAKKLFNVTNVDGLFESSIIHFLPLAYIRGTNLDNSIIILDETQNVSIDNARTLLTRIGGNSKIICLGDTNQIDLRNKYDSSLNVLLKIFNNVDDIGTITMDENDENCRNPIIKTIEQKFKEYSENGKTSQKSKTQILHG